MTKMKTADAIKTSSEIKSYRSLRHGVAVSLSSLDWGRVKMGREEGRQKGIGKSGFRPGPNVGQQKESSDVEFQ